MSIRSDPAGWLDPRHRLGFDGEEIAKAYLSGRGWQILEHRYRVGRIEVDLVVRRGQVVAFVEVKTRASSRFGSPLEAVTARKRRDIARAALAWVDRRGRPHDVYRFDVVAVVRMGSGRARIRHVPDAFRPGWR